MKHLFMFLTVLSVISCKNKQESKQNVTAPQIPIIADKNNEDLNSESTTPLENTKISPWYVGTWKYHDTRAHSFGSGTEKLYVYIVDSDASVKIEEWINGTKVISMLGDVTVNENSTGNSGSIPYSKWVITIRNIDMSIDSKYQVGQNISCIFLKKFKYDAGVDVMSMECKFGNDFPERVTDAGLGLIKQ